MSTVRPIVAIGDLPGVERAANWAALEAKAGGHEGGVPH